MTDDFELDKKVLSCTPMLDSNSCVDDLVLFCEVHPFDEEVEVYKENLLKALMDLAGKEIMRLTLTQRQVLLGLFFQGQSIRHLGTQYGVSHVSILDTKNRAVKTLRRRLQNNPYFMELYNKYRAMDPPMSIITAISNLLNK